MPQVVPAVFSRPKPRPCKEIVMRYKNAKAILPEELLAELQKYAEGELIYIPNRQTKAGWGTVNGSRQRYALRNMQILQYYKNGSGVDEISRQFFLSKDSIKKIIKSCPDQSVEM
jgi:Mor family transcriptional regulator